MSDSSVPSEDTSAGGRARLLSLGGGGLRALLLLALAAGFMSALEIGPALGGPDPALPVADLPQAEAHRASALSIQLDAITPADAWPLEWRELNDPGLVSPARLTRREELALQAQARTWTAKLRASRQAEEARTALVFEELEAARISLDFAATPMALVIAFLQDSTQLSYVVSPAAQTLIDDEAIEVSLKLEDISLLNALKLILLSHEDLSFRVREGVILIHVGETPPQLELAALTVEDIVSGRLQGQGGASISSEVLVELVEDVLSDEGSVEFTRGPSASPKETLLLRAPPADLARARACLRQLRVVDREPAPEPSWIAHYREALGSCRVSLDFLAAPLADALSSLQDQAGLSLTIPSGVDPDLLVDVKVKELPLGTALRLILEQVDLVWSFAGETLVVHEPSDERYSALEVIVLDVRDLLAWMTPDLLEFAVYEALEGDLHLDWDERESLRIHRGQLVLRQSYTRSLKARQVLAQLRVSHADSERAAQVR